MNLTTIPNLDSVSIQPQSLNGFDGHAKAARSALLALPNNRAYALDDTALTSLVAAFRTFWEAIAQGLIEKFASQIF